MGGDLEARLMGEPRVTQYPVQPRLDREAPMADVEIETGADLVMLFPDMDETEQREEDTDDAADKVLAAWRAHYSRKKEETKDSEEVSEASTEKSDKGSGSRPLQPSIQGISGSVQPTLERPELEEVSRAQSDLMMGGEALALHEPIDQRAPMGVTVTAVGGENLQLTQESGQDASLQNWGKTASRKKQRDDSADSGAAPVALPPPRPELGDGDVLAQSDRIMEADKVLPMPDRPQMKSSIEGGHAQSDLLMGPDVPLQVLVREAPKASGVPQTPMDVQMVSGVGFQTSGASVTVAPVQPQMERDAGTLQAEVLGGFGPDLGENDWPPRPQRPRMDDSDVRAQDNVL